MVVDRKAVAVYVPARPVSEVELRSVNYDSLDLRERYAYAAAAPFNTSLTCIRIVGEVQDQRLPRREQKGLLVRLWRKFARCERSISGSWPSQRPYTVTGCNGLPSPVSFSFWRSHPQCERVGAERVRSKGERRKVRRVGESRSLLEMEG